MTQEIEQTKDRVVRVFKENPYMLANDVAEELGVTRQYVSKVLKKAGVDVKIRSKEVIAHNIKKKEDTFMEYFKEGATIKEMRDKMGISQAELYQIQTTLGVKFNDLRDMRRARLVNKIRNEIENGKIKKDIAKELGISKGYISTTLRWGRENEELVEKYKTAEDSFDKEEE